MNIVFLWLMALLYILAGIFHFVRPRFYIKMMPRWVPWHKGIVYASGICEMILGLLLLPALTRTVAAWGIIILLILIFPANIQMTLNFHRKKHPFFWMTIARLPLQLVLIWWAWQYT